MLHNFFRFLSAFTATISAAIVTQIYAEEAIGTESRIVNESAVVPYDWEQTKSIGDHHLGMSRDTVSIHSIIGPDEREAINDLEQYPLHSMAQFSFIDINGERGTCSGIMYGPRSLMTAAHCLYGQQGWHSNFEIFPGTDGQTQPHGTCSWVTADIDPRFLKARQPDFDLGALQLDCTIGMQTGWVQPGGNVSVLPGENLVTYGYPLDIWPIKLHKSEGYAKALTVESISYDLDTAMGQSGSPVFSPSAFEKPVAIHSAGTEEYNVGVLLGNSQRTQLLNWSAIDVTLIDTHLNYSSSQ